MRECSNVWEKEAMVKHISICELFYSPTSEQSVS